MSMADDAGTDSLRLGRFIPSGRTLVILVPLIWLFVFFILPLFLVLKISVSEAALARPPYLPLFEWSDDNFLKFTLNFGNYAYLIEDSLYYKAYLESVTIAFFSTIICLLIGYPMAYYIAKQQGAFRAVLLLMIVLPFWTSFLLRVYAWIGFLKSNGLINNSLMSSGIIDAPLQIIQTDLAVYIGIVYTYLPFMILPLFATLAKLDETYLEAASDLGAKPVATFFTVTLPLSLPGGIAGCMLVFIPAVGEFVIPALLGGPDTLMIGRVLWNEFFSNRDWPIASAVAIVMLLVLVIPIMILRRAQAAEEANE